MTEIISNEDKKKYLVSYREHSLKARRLEQEINMLRLNKFFPGLTMSDMPCAHDKKDLSDYVCKVEELTQAVVSERKKAIDKYMEVRKRIEMLEKEEERQVLFYKYTMNKSWEKIAEIMGYSVRQVYRVHGQALVNFEI